MLMMWHFLRYILSLTLPAYFRKIQVLHPERIPPDKPAILSFNHPNAFTDPLGITFGIWPIRTWYMARGDVFKPGIISWILENIGIVPIFRFRDAGKEGLEKNHQSYQRVYYLLKKNKKVIVFSEGLCVQERRLRPIKKGVPRMVFFAFEEIKNPHLSVIPVGLFYENPHKFHSDLLYTIGNPIPISSWMDAYRKEPNKTLHRFQQHLENEMKNLVIHIENPYFDGLAEQLEIIYYHEFLFKNRLKPAPLHRFTLAKKITDSLNSLSDTSMAEPLIQKLNELFHHCRRNRIRPWMADEWFFKNLSITDKLLFYFLLILLPVHLAGYIYLLIPVSVSVFLTKKIVRAKEFYTSFLIGIGSFVLLIYILLFGFAASLFFSDQRYPVFVLWVLTSILLSGFWFRNHILYIKIFSYIWKGKHESVVVAKKMMQECKSRWESLTNFKV